MLSASKSRTMSWVLMALVFVVALGYGATADRGPRSDQERAAALSSSIACPQCTGQPVSESNAPIAETIRTQIKQQVDAGLTDQQIVQVYVDRYGEWLLVQLTSLALAERRELLFDLLEKRHQPRGIWLSTA